MGSGFAIIQVSRSYNLNVTGEWPLFKVDPQLFKNANQNRMQLTICSRCVGSGFTLETEHCFEIDSTFTVNLNQ